jgi:hypothetical protein
MAEAKEVHRSLRKAAGIFKLIECDFSPKLTEKQIEAGDLDPRVISAYLTQCTAEAQEGRVLCSMCIPYTVGQLECSHVRVLYALSLLQLGCMYAYICLGFRTLITSALYCDQIDNEFQTKFHYTCSDFREHTEISLCTGKW